MTALHLSLAEARRIALAAQGFGRPRPSRPAGPAAILATVRRLGLVQIDYVTVVVPAQYQVLFARHGPFDRAHLDALLFRRRCLVEQWAHEASIVPVETWPLLAHRRAAHRARPWGFDDFLRRHPGYVAGALDRIRKEGALAAEDLPHPEGHASRLEHSWYGTVRRATLEALFGRGVLAISGRRSDFARLYDLAERVVPAAQIEGAMERPAAEREMLRTAARAHGIATAGDLADYWRMTVRDARPRIAELAASGELVPARVEAWREPAWLHREARAPERIDAAALLSPFDPLVWTRRRTSRLFGFEYRLEIFVPEARRRYGAYVLPLLLGDRLVGRLDLKADRAGGRLLVRSAHLEAGAAAGPSSEAAAAELVAMASWLGLGKVAVDRRGDLAARARGGRPGDPRDGAPRAGAGAEAGARATPASRPPSILADVPGHRRRGLRVGGVALARPGDARRGPHSSWRAEA